MKTISLFFALTLLPFSSFAEQALNDKALLCELVDVGRGRILDRKQLTIHPDSQKPILMLMGMSPVTGTVRDFPGADPMSRKIELSLDYNHGSGNSHGQAGSQYRLDGRAPRILLAEVGVNGGFGQALSLRCFLRTISPKMDLMSRTTTESGRGYSSNYCEGNGWASSCIRDIERRAKEDASRDAEFSCRMRGGNARSYSSYCSSYCSPSWIPSGSPRRVVSCSANCTVSCEIP